MSAEDQLVKVNIKWGKKAFPDVEIDTSESPAIFKSQVWTLTGVPPERQTILGFKGGKLKDDSDWIKLAPKQGLKLMLIGTADENRLAPPTNLPKVHNDLDVKDGVVDILPTGPPGLVNLQNTCYANATVQCLKNVPPLIEALSDFKGSTNALNPADKLTASLRDVMSRLKSANTEQINPMGFIQTLRNVNPQFAERGQHGMFSQQDAEECWNELLTRLATSLKQEDNTNTVDQLFGFEMEYVDSCTETDEKVSRKENTRALKCHISSSVNHVDTGIKEGLQEPIEKTSEQLGRMAKWDRTSKLNSLPHFLNLQFVRFHWKASEQVKAKVLRNVSYPFILDLHDYCTDPLKKQLSAKRDEIIKEQEAKEKEAGSSSGAASSSSGALSKDEGINLKGVGKGSGHYELSAVLTHKGRTAESGHYVAWVKQDDKRWCKFDDEKVTYHTDEEIKKLSGGGDWHTAYICLYRAV